MSDLSVYGPITKPVVKKKFPNPPGKRKEWDQITVEKKMLFELRRIADTLDLLFFHFVPAKNEKTVIDVKLKK